MLSGYAVSQRYHCLIGCRFRFAVIAFGNRSRGWKYIMDRFSSTSSAKAFFSCIGAGETLDAFTFFGILKEERGNVSVVKKV